MRYTTAERRGLPSNAFALPGRRFPISNASHARAALSGASRALHAGTITRAEAERVQSKAKAKLRSM